MVTQTKKHAAFNENTGTWTRVEVKQQKTFQEKMKAAFFQKMKKAVS